MYGSPVEARLAKAYSSRALPIAFGADRVGQPRSTESGDLIDCELSASW
jgi:hypothetical protein